MRDHWANGATGKSVTLPARGRGARRPVVGRRPRRAAGDLPESVGRAVRHLIKTPRRREPQLPRIARPAATSQLPGRGFPAI